MGRTTRSTGPTAKKATPKKNPTKNGTKVVKQAKEETVYE